MQGTGVRFPAIAVTAATAGGSPAATPSGMAPRSSTTGTIAIKKVIASLPNTLSPKIMYVPSRAIRRVSVSKSSFRPADPIFRTYKSSENA